MHVVFLCDGLPEGIDRFKKEIDRRDFGNGGAPSRLREIKIFDWQFDSKDKKDVMSILRNNNLNPKFEKKLAYEMRHEENPFKRGHFNRLICFFVRYFGWVIGAEPWETWKEKDLPEPQVRGWLCNFFPIAMVRDNFAYNKVHKILEEWL